MSGAPKPRRTASLAKSLDKQLNLYTLAARANCRLKYAAVVSASGATVMSLAPVAEARIIYTPTQMKIAPNSHSILIDFNHQPNGGEGEFGFARSTGCFILEVRFWCGRAVLQSSVQRDCGDGRARVRQRAASRRTHGTS